MFNECVAKPHQPAANSVRLDSGSRRPTYCSRDQGLRMISPMMANFSPATCEGNDISIIHTRNLKAICLESEFPAIGYLTRYDGCGSLRSISGVRISVGKFLNSATEPTGHCYRVTRGKHADFGTNVHFGTRFLQLSATAQVVCSRV